MVEDRLQLPGECAACRRSICDRYIMRVADANYHERCLLCCACGSRLAHSCFTKDAKLYCRIDYDRLYAKKCLGCSEKVSPEELVMRALDSVFHLRCFVCVVCGGRLQKGDQFVIKQGQLFCRPDYEKEVEMLQGYAPGEFPCDDLITTSARPHDGRRGPKRPRTILTTQQRRAFKASFELSPKPCRKVRETLAKDTGLSVRIVQVWFQNQRAKMKKMQKKARQDGKILKDSEDSEPGNSSSTKSCKIKEEDQSPQGVGYLNECSSDTEAGSLAIEGYGAEVDGASHYLPLKEDPPGTPDPGEVASLFFKHQEFAAAQVGPHHHAKLAGNNGPFMSAFPYGSCPPEAAMAGGGPPAGMFGGGHQHPMTPSLNPIDRLYSMQNSYFCGEDGPTLADQ
ncbi:LIM homeobox transcription factor 1-beta [Cloeon dipterum]|uniref:LIM homeobox transcription factor 1-beta n=1 Tax=Cloeon dipterum TaxID=197152 RepID=UPI00322086C1